MENREVERFLSNFGGFRNFRNFTITVCNLTSPSWATSPSSMGKYSLQIAIDVSGNGQLPWPPSTQPNADTLFYNITLFLTSESQSHNFTISNGTEPSNNSSYVGPVLELEPSSTVKHVNWVWPECLVGDGDGDGDSARGAYNISMHQSFRWNGTDYYTVFDLPISVTNSISKSSGQLECAQLENQLLSATEESESSDTLP
ncbi:hypothetical protein N7509_011110 [Penicillium cosmopolitanum]|uniref:Uncharacterized protein n=1 Tax=Penicillium cosmopolitanum TaxID=1131564 RepID=A0A9W9VSV7_9EURO|nr:uncharacterized protein N7509_011110 [Penicillium cosmopolitanum]KAJ5388569.1 hypothetical protein N7509_011110 [Penicillium cosmopolitanum]